ncbi:hypothetical protein OUZ56_003347 [Daphnia magna]|uniref:Uncharacterized protein n=1 Tax=Daphnia magna TaxID=35525 RepID=A0ABR0A8I0_9CRUS|nr:hypothetical protein OUZ56_003347 [Daphnia magna]
MKSNWTSQELTRLNLEDPENLLSHNRVSIGMTTFDELEALKKVDAGKKESSKPKSSKMDCLSFS